MTELMYRQMILYLRSKSLQAKNFVASNWKANQSKNSKIKD